MVAYHRCYWWHWAWASACHLVELKLGKWTLVLAWEQWSNQWHADQVKVRGRDGQHQPGGEGVGEEDSELPEERGPRWEDQQAQAPGLIDGSYMKGPPPINSILLYDCLLKKNWAHYLFAHLKRSLVIITLSTRVTRWLVIIMLITRETYFSINGYLQMFRLLHLKASSGFIYLTKIISRNIRGFSALKPKSDIVVLNWHNVS